MKSSFTTMLVAVLVIAAVAMFEKTGRAAALPLGALSSMVPTATPTLHPVLLHNQGSHYVRGWASYVVKDLDGWRGKGHRRLTVRFKLDPEILESAHAHVYLFPMITKTSQASVGHPTGISLDLVSRPGFFSEWTGGSYPLVRVTGLFFTGEVQLQHVYRNGRVTLSGSSAFVRDDGSSHPPAKIVTGMAMGSLTPATQSIPPSWLDAGRVSFPVRSVTTQLDTKSGNGTYEASLDPDECIRSASYAQPVHPPRRPALEEYRPGEWLECSWQLDRTPLVGADAVRISIALYHEGETGDEAFALYRPHQDRFTSENGSVPLQFKEEGEVRHVDYPNDPTVLWGPWKEQADHPDPVWLSHFSYLLTPLTRPSMMKLFSNADVNLHAPSNRDPEPTLPNFWPWGMFAQFYPQVLLDWTFLLGTEAAQWTLSWVTPLFELKSWRAEQPFDTGHGTRAVLPSHSFVSTWLKHQYAYLYPFLHHYPWQGPSVLPPESPYRRWYSEGHLASDPTQALRRTLLPFRDPGGAFKHQVFNDLEMAQRIPFKSEDWPLSYEGRKILEKKLFTVTSGDVLVFDPDTGEKEQYAVNWREPVPSLQKKVDPPATYAWTPTLPPLFGQLGVMAAPDLLSTLLASKEMEWTLANWFWVQIMSESPYPNSFLYDLGEMGWVDGFVLNIVLGMALGPALFPQSRTTFDAWLRQWYWSLPWASNWDRPRAVDPSRYHTSDSGYSGLDFLFKYYGDLALGDPTATGFSADHFHYQKWLSTAFYPVAGAQVLVGP